MWGFQLHNQCSCFQTDATSYLFNNTQEQRYTVGPWLGTPEYIGLFSWPYYLTFSFSGEHPQPRPGYQLKEPDGCASSLVGFQVHASVGSWYHLQPKSSPFINTQVLYHLNHPDMSFSLFWQLDLGIPAMTNCCNQLDVCYETCGTNKYDCDSEFRSCLHGLCADINKSLGFVSQVQGKFRCLLCGLW